MEFVLLLLTATLVIFTLHSPQYRRSLLSVFLLMWLSVFLLYSLRLYGLYDSKDRTFTMYIIGVSCFFLGYLMFRPSRNNWQYVKRDSLERIKNITLIVLSVVSAYVLIRKSILALPYWMSGGGGDVKNAIIMDDGLNIGGPLEIFYTFIARPVQIVMVIYAVTTAFQKKKNKLFILLAFLLTLFGYVSSGSKFSVAEIAFMIFGYVFLYSGMNLKEFISKYKVIFVSLIGIVVIITLIMSMGDADVLRNYYTYACGCIPCSDNALQRLDGTTYLYGLASFNGVLRCINLVPYYFGLTAGFKEILDTTFMFMMDFEATMYIADDIPYNAFVSMFTYFYADGGYNAVAALSFVFGLICSWGIKWSLKESSICSVSLCLLLLLFVIQSLVRIQTFYAPNAMAIFLIIFLFPRTSLYSYNT